SGAGPRGSEAERRTLRGGGRACRARRGPERRRARLRRVQARRSARLHAPWPGQSARARARIVGRSTMNVMVTVNGVERSGDVEPRTLLAHFLRTTLDLTGTHVGCDTSNCGACTILLDGKPVKSCTMFAVQADGRNITTVEGLKHDGQLDPIQQGFKEMHGLQCGFCTPAMMLVSKALLDRNPDPSEDDIRWELSGNLCRCTGYVNIVKAIQWAAKARA